ncbi:MAG: hypothetical protein FWD66_10560, partial [Paludibacter sp.]|nr:hypothetical protein [Paludibacter sp.]
APNNVTDSGNSEGSTKMKIYSLKHSFILLIFNDLKFYIQMNKYYSLKTTFLIFRVSQYY